MEKTAKPFCLCFSLLDVDKLQYRFIWCELQHEHSYHKPKTKLTLLSSPKKKQNKKRIKFCLFLPLYANRNMFFNKIRQFPSFCKDSSIFVALNSEKGWKLKYYTKLLLESISPTLYKRICANKSLTFTASTKKFRAKLSYKMQRIKCW
jgi:hypothetical protein